MKVSKEERAKEERKKLRELWDAVSTVAEGLPSLNHSSDAHFAALLYPSDNMEKKEEGIQFALGYIEHFLRHEPDLAVGKMRTLAGLLEKAMRGQYAPVSTKQEDVLSFMYVTLHTDKRLPSREETMAETEAGERLVDKIYAKIRKLVPSCDL